MGLEIERDYETGKKNYATFGDYLATKDIVKVGDIDVELESPTHAAAEKVKELLASVAKRWAGKKELTEDEITEGIVCIRDMSLYALKACLGGVDGETVGRIMLKFQREHPKDLVKLILKALEQCAIPIDDEFANWIKLFYVPEVRKCGKKSKSK